MSFNQSRWVEKTPPSHPTNVNEDELSFGSLALSCLVDIELWSLNTTVEPYIYHTGYTGISLY